MEDKILQKIKKNISDMDWNDIASAIIELESEIDILKDCLSKKELETTYKLLKLYEEEKSKRVKRESKITIVNDPIYGIHYSSGDDFDE